MNIGGHVAAAAFCAVVLTSAGHAETQMSRGKFLATIMDCGGCHTTGAFAGKPDPAKYGAGSDIGWFIPEAGVFYPSNITPDKETGIGIWSEAEIVKALKTGVIPGGRVLMPIMPWHAYRQATDADLRAIAKFLKTIPVVHHEVPGPTALKDLKTPYLTVATPARE